MRMYQPVWEKLKKDGRCSVAAAPELHARIKKAVIKEKYNDTTYKVECDLKGITAEIEVRIEKSKITFILKRSIGLGDL
jgi:hypothetical protein